MHVAPKQAEVVENLLLFVIVYRSSTKQDKQNATLKLLGVRHLSVSFNKEEGKEGPARKYKN